MVIIYGHYIRDYVNMASGYVEVSPVDELKGFLSVDIRSEYIVSVC